MVKNPVESTFYGVFCFSDLQINHQNCVGFYKPLSVLSGIRTE